MRLPSASKARKEPDLTGVINIVFLILIFFVIAGSLRPYSARDIKLAKTVANESQSGISAPLVVHADGRIVYRGGEVVIDELEGVLAGDDRRDGSRPLVIVADHRLDAGRMLDVLAKVRAAGVKDTSILTERVTE